MPLHTFTAQDGATVQISPNGAHIVSWKPAGGSEQLFLSKASSFAKGSAIRGGVPVIFPQFSGMGVLPKHGFARTSEWTLKDAGRNDQGAAQASFELRENIARLTLWPHVFCATLQVTALGNALQITLEVDNSGDTTFSFTCALHTYLAVADITQATLHGLQGLHYRDTLTGAQDCIERAEVLRITGETDRIYTDVCKALTLQQPHQSVRISAHGFSDAVVWNPGATGAVKMADLEAGGQLRMLCVEAANIAHPVCLQPGQRWSGSQMLEVLPNA